MALELLDSGSCGGRQSMATSPDKWKEPRLFHLPFDEEFASRISVGHSAVPDALPDRHMADNNAYRFATIFPDRTKPGIWNTDVLIYNERDYLVRIRLKNIHYCRDIGWVNEKLLRIRVWWGRICATDIIVDVEREQIIYKEMVWDGAIPFQQFQEANKASQDVDPANRNEQQPPSKTTSTEDLPELVKSGDPDDS